MSHLGDANGITSGLGLLECQDVVGLVRYAKEHRKPSRMKTGLYSCIGGNSTTIAMAKWPEAFTQIQALVFLNVVFGKTFIERAAETLSLNPQRAAAQLDERVRQLTRFRLEVETLECRCRHLWRRIGAIS